MPDKRSFEEIAGIVEELCSDLADEISLEDVQRHPGLHRILLAADDLGGRYDRQTLDWMKRIEPPAN